LAIFVSREGECVFPWLFSSAAEKIVPFIGSLAEPAKKWFVSLAVVVSRQENSVFPWLLG